MAPQVALTVHADLDTLPQASALLFAGGEKRFFFDSRTWYRALIAAALPEDGAPCFVVCHSAGRPLVLFPMQSHHDRRSLRSLTAPYTCLHRPLIAPGAEPAVLHEAGRVFARFCQCWPTVRLDALDPACPGLAPLLAGAARGGLVAQHFDHFGNWHEPVAGLTWDRYFAGRPGTLRETIRRKLRRAEADLATDFELVATSTNVEHAIDAYETVYARSWKSPEPFARFSACMIREAALAGVLRLGILRRAGRPVAVQVWVLTNGTATLLKLAHDETFKPLSPGTVLTAMMIRELLDREGVDELDFGRGDDAYKRLWASRRRQRVGVMLFNPRRRQGVAALARHLLGRVRRHVVGPPRGRV